VPWGVGGVGVKSKGSPGFIGGVHDRKITVKKDPIMFGRGGQTKSKRGVGA